MAAANLLASAAAKRYEAVPVAFAGERALLVAMADPANVLAIDDIALMTRLRGPPGGRLARGHRRADQRA